jgi:hypothetical protein
MDIEITEKLCITESLKGLVNGLSVFSEPSKVALIYSIKKEGPIKVCDPQKLLTGHELKIKDLYIKQEIWKDENSINLKKSKGFQPEENLQLSGLISFGGRSESVYYQMWFTEHHLDMCSIGPTKKLLEQTAWLFSRDYANRKLGVSSSGYVWQNFSNLAVHDFMNSELDLKESSLNIFDILKAILEISRTPEEGAWARGNIIFTDDAKKMKYILKFSQDEKPRLHDYKYVRKMLQTVERSDRFLISDGAFIYGISNQKLKDDIITVEFLGDHGFITIGSRPVCSFSDGSYYSSSRRANLVDVEEILLERFDDIDDAQSFLARISVLVRSAEKNRYGCSIVIDLNEKAMSLSGQVPEKPIDLKDSYMLQFATSLTRIDGALHIGKDLKLYGFACLLDGTAIKGENRARGARYNSALRFTSGKKNVIVVVVSSDRPVSIISDGKELNSKEIWKPQVEIESSILLEKILE